MLYSYLKVNYKELEPIFFSDINIEDISKSALNQQFDKLCDDGLLKKYDTEIYFIPKKSSLNIDIGPSADMVAQYRYITNGKEVYGFYSGHTLANKIGISLQVPNTVEIVTNKTNSSDREVLIKNRKFYIRKPIVKVNSDNVHTLELLDLLKNLDAYIDYSYEEVKEIFKEFINKYDISKSDIDEYIRLYPNIIFKYYYELGLDYVLTQR